MPSKAALLRTGGYQGLHHGLFNREFLLLSGPVRLGEHCSSTPTPAPPMPTPADDLAQMMAAVLVYRPQPWAWPPATLSAPPPPPPPADPPAGGGAVLEVQ
jgi:hypothetical protein